MKRQTVVHEFVEYIPDRLQEGTIYVSISFATAIHQCCCGCGNKVVTPLSPTDWELSFDGESISLDPSIGNWSFPCQSHYWIKHNKVRWAESWSRDRIEAGRARERQIKEKYFGKQIPQSEPAKPDVGHKENFLKRLKSGGHAPTKTE